MIHQTEVDGVPTLFAPDDGPVRAGLVFRVGQADETLPTAGMTHLLEHLVLHRIGMTSHRANGSTEAFTTTFLMQGSPEDFLQFFASVCDALADLPVERLAEERELLSAGREQRPLALDLARRRYGAQGYGLAGFPDFGIRTVTGEQLRDWSRTRFTRQNAVLWVAGPQLPAGLRLRLPDGERPPAPPVRSVLARTPAYFAQGHGFVQADAVVPRSVAASAFSGILERHLHRTMRREAGPSYLTGSEYQVRADGNGVILAYADARVAPAVLVEGLVGALSRLRDGDIAPTDLAAVRSDWVAELSHPRADALRISTEAEKLLVGYPNATSEVLAGRFAALTEQDIAEVGALVWADMLLQVPGGQEPPADSGFVPARTHSTTAVEGTALVCWQDKDVVLVSGAAGLSLITDDGARTVRFDACAAMQAWSDGSRRLIGLDGVSLTVDPESWVEGAALVDDIDTRIPAALVIAMPSRPAAPAPPAPTGQPSGLLSDTLMIIALIGSAPLLLAAGLSAAGVAMVALLIASILVALWLAYEVCRLRRRHLTDDNVRRSGGTAS